MRPSGSGDSRAERATYDLHLHTCFSYDATTEPEAYFQAAVRLGMRCIAITDHHVFDARTELRELAPQYPDVVLIPGAELSVETSLGSVDLLCLGLPFDIPADLVRVFARYHEWQREYGAGMCAGMRALGFDYTVAHQEELLRSYRPARALDMQGMTRVKNEVLRQYFIERGFIDDETAYKELVRQVRRGGHLPDYPGVSDVIPAVRATGALVSIAHPFGCFEGRNERRMDSLREECDLDGIECAHHTTPLEFTAQYRAYCGRHGLVATAGSDTHVPEEIDAKLGRHHGEEAWLDEILDRLQAGM